MMKEVIKTLSGTWRNDLGSIMVLQAKEDGSLSGKYRTIVGKAKDEEFPLSGQFSVVKNNEAVLGFTVCFKSVKEGAYQSVVSHSGQLLKDRDGKYKLFTTWLLTRYTGLEDNWESTITNKAIFERIE